MTLPRPYALTFAITLADNSCPERLVTRPRAAASEEPPDPASRTHSDDSQPLLFAIRGPTSRHLLDSPRRFYSKIMPAPSLTERRGSDCLAPSLVRSNHKQRVAQIVCDKLQYPCYMLDDSRKEPIWRILTSFSTAILTKKICDPAVICWFEEKV